MVRQRSDPRRRHAFLAGAPTMTTELNCLGLPIEGFDAQIAAICRVRGAALATRNIKDFAETGIDVIDPWQSG